MITMNSTTPPLPTPRDLEAVLSLVTLLSDPKATATRIAEFSSAAADAGKVIEQAEKDRASITALRAQTEKDLAVKQAAHSAKLVQEREAHDEACRRRTEQLDAREKGIKELQAKAETDAAEAARIKADLQRRIRIISGEAA